MSADGTIQAVEIRALFDGGAYGAGKPGPSVLPGRVPKLPYTIANARVERIAAYTNTIPGAFVRAPGEVQMIFGVESLIDIAAGELGIDPLELRLRNAARDGTTDLEGNVFASPRPVTILERLKTELKWGTALPKGRGRGVAVTARHIAGGKTNIVVHVEPSGDLTIDTGSTEPGVGTFTVLQRVLAADLGLDPTRIKVVRSATDTAPVDPGIGGSKGTLLLGRAALDAAKKIKLALERAEALHLPWEEAARAITRDGPLKIDGVGEYVHKPDEPMWVNFGGYGVDLSVDPETGETTFHDVVFIADVGTVINPVAHRGQINGGFSMGFGHAFTEELRLDGGRIVNIALSDYKLPTQADMPPFRVVSLEPDGGPGPFGARAAGEFNISGVAPAIANAIANACGVRLDSLGLTAERIHAALH
jgi:CO/xanthine dehydrogenase Mo-binding subunit